MQGAGARLAVLPGAGPRIGTGSGPDRARIGAGSVPDWSPIPACVFPVHNSTGSAPDWPVHFLCITYPQPCAKAVDNLSTGVDKKKKKKKKKKKNFEIFIKFKKNFFKLNN